MPIYADIDLYGRDDENGKAIEFFDEDAIKNALQSWLSLEKGGILKDPSSGGALDSFVFKNMSRENLNDLAFNLKNQFINNFSPALQFDQIQLDPDYENRILRISVIYTNPNTGYQSVASVLVNTSYATNNFEYKDIDLVGEELLQFCMLNKYDQLDKKLLLSELDNIWYWGKYKFINFNISDEYFDDILLICNGG